MSDVKQIALRYRAIADEAIAMCKEQAAELTRLRARIEALQSERLFIVGANHGYETAMEQVAEEARRYASHYSEATDGRNTFILFADWAEQAALSAYEGTK